jgi:hypothetical protein
MPRVYPCAVCGEFIKKRDDDYLIDDSDPIPEKRVHARCWPQYLEQKQQAPKKARKNTRA